MAQANVEAAVVGTLGYRPTMMSAATSRKHHHSGWRAVAAVWMVVVALTGALVLVQREGEAGSPASLRSLAAAARLAHLKMADPEGAT
ncbi:MAG TPA: hypothetical protein VKU84_16105, partial [Stellaceae bacterium]|nr:hypothetical protein [Stellaceae bacterium]